MEIVQQIRTTLRELSDKSIQKSAQNFFKEPVKCYGIKSANVRAISKKIVKQSKTENKEQVFALCEGLWKSGYLEESIIACDLAYSRRKEFEPEDFTLFEKWVLHYINNWASCDTFCNHTLGAFIELYPKYIEQLKRWAKEDNRWLRRAAAVSLIIPARAGKFIDEALDIANMLLLDKDDLVQKGYGWLLKVSSKHHEKRVFEYIMANKAKMSRTALRYAIEKMPAVLKTAAMAK